MIEQLNDSEVAAQEVLHTTTIWVAGILGLTE
jgi:hypothetical protein